MERVDDAGRISAVLKSVFIVATVAVAVINGQSASPLFWSFDQFLKPFVAPFSKSPVVLYYVTSVFLSLMTLLIAGIPAALYERLRGSRASTPVSIGLWFVVALLLTVPTLHILLGFED